MPSGYKKDGSFAGSVFKKGHTPWMKDKHHAANAKKKIGKAAKDRIPWIQG